MGLRANKLTNHARHPYLFQVDGDLFNKFRDAVPLDGMTQHLDALVRLYVEQPEARDILVRKPKLQKHAFFYEADASVFDRFMEIVPPKKAAAVLSKLIEWWLENRDGFEIHWDINKGEWLDLKKFDDKRT